uniref:Uncharacterized protein n=1 Tax=Fagus sylvatica TaxID=28930 RepID=A0A2N9FWR4_FAGSY
MGTYEVEIDGAKVKVSVVDNVGVLGGKIDELKSLLETSQIGVVGVDVKSIQSTESSIEDEVNECLSNRYYLRCSTGVEVGHFASKILKKANIEKLWISKVGW